MTVEFVLFLIAGALAGGFVNGLAGFGTALFSLGWWLQIMPPLQAVAVVLVVSVASGIHGTLVIRHAIVWPRLALFLLPALVGIPFGLQILHRIDADLLKIVIACFLLMYGGFFLLRRELPNLTRNTPVADVLIGFAGGILGAVAGLSGALPTVWLSLRAWSKEKSRAVIQPYNMVVLGISALLLLFQGAFDRQVIVFLVITLPVSIFAAQCGVWLFQKLTDTLFRRLLIAMMFVSGMTILLQQLI